MDYFADDGCGVFEGRTGMLIVGSMAAGAFASYIAFWGLRYFCKSAQRTATVFFLDLAKIALGQGMAWLISVLNTMRNAATSHKFDSLAWYFPTFLADEIITVPLAVLLGLLLTLLARTLGRSAAVAKWTDAIHHFGRYEPDDAASQELLLTRPRGPRASWWAAQLALWLLCVAAARVVSSLLVPVLTNLLGEASPFYLLARWIHELDWPCDTKQWVFAGALRALIHLLQILFVDLCNRYVLPVMRVGRTGASAPALAVGSRVRALWKYAKQYDDELSFEAGDLLIIEGEVPGEELWFRARLGNQSGLIPSNYVVDESGAPINSR